MTETVEQPANSFPETPLTARLFRRASEPLGVVDVRHPERLQERGTAWIEQRVALLERWKTRYGLTAPVAPAERPVVTSTQPFAMRSALASTAATPAAPVAQQFRVKRPVEARSADIPAAIQPLQPAAAAFTGRSSEAEPEAPVATDRTSLVRASELIASPSVPAPQVFRKSPQLAGGAANSTMATPTVSPPDRLGVPVPQLSASSQTAVPVASPAPAALSATPWLLPATPASPESSELLLRRKATEPSPPASATELSDSGRALPVALGTTIAPLPGSASFTQAIGATGPPPAPLVLARKADQTKRPPGSGSAAPLNRNPAASAMAQEIPAPGSVRGEAQIVWRKADPDAAASGRSLPPPITTGPSAQIMRAPAITSSSGVPTAALQSAATPQGSHGGVDVEHLAERVSRVIARQLTVERERRGMHR